ncbi:GGDEF domain-containing protein [Oryzifoliimicrobium ureilyticus]|uniref:GGDEF domain-containing protein n=1 Tax=Oryzifoliimicrobium ureilyticus TaxID=3113724 RepID=UPI0030767071
MAINASIGIAFAAMFVGLSMKYDLPMGRWCAAGFICAAFFVALEAIVPASFAPLKLSLITFAGLLAALGLISVGVQRRYQPAAQIWPVAILFFILVLSHILFIAYSVRDSLIHAFGYQLPYFALGAVGALCIFRSNRRRPADWFLFAVLLVMALQFVAKAVLARRLNTGADFGSYIVSQYAHYSQSIGAVLAILLGLSLLMVMAEDVMKQVRDSLQRDHLSGLWNRGAFVERANHILEKHEAGAVVVLCDLDHFKVINDTFGHDVGDEVISAFSRSLKDGGGELCGRIGGEEFAVLFANGSVAELRQFVDRVGFLFSNVEFGIASLKPTASFGIAFATENDRLEDLLKRADAALYDAKRAGRNTFRFAPAPDLEGQVAKIANGDEL